MASESCIHPNCKCKSYKDPGHPNGYVLIRAQHHDACCHVHNVFVYRTLLFLKLKCKQCGHHGSEHRKLTVVDNLVKDEVMKAAEVRCCHLVPLTDVPYSPVFKPHDPIPIPYDSSEYDQVCIKKSLHVHEQTLHCIYTCILCIIIFYSSILLLLCIDVPV